MAFWWEALLHASSSLILEKSCPRLPGVPIYKTEDNIVRDELIEKNNMIYGDLLEIKVWYHWTAKRKALPHTAFRKVWIHDLKHRPWRFSLPMTRKNTPNSKHPTPHHTNRCIWTTLWSYLSFYWKNFNFISFQNTNLTFLLFVLILVSNRILFV